METLYVTEFVSLNFESKWCRRGKRKSVSQFYTLWGSNCRLTSGSRKSWTVKWGYGRVVRASGVTCYVQLGRGQKSSGNRVLVYERTAVEKFESVTSPSIRNERVENEKPARGYHGTTRFHACCPLKTNTRRRNETFLRFWNASVPCCANWFKARLGAFGRVVPLKSPRFQDFERIQNATGARNVPQCSSSSRVPGLRAFPGSIGCGVETPWRRFNSSRFLSLVHARPWDIKTRSDRWSP